MVRYVYVHICHTHLILLDKQETKSDIKHIVYASQKVYTNLQYIL